MNMTTVYVEHLKAVHQKEPMTKFLPLSRGQCDEINSIVKNIFDKAGGKSLLKSSKDVYLKPNAVDAQPYCYTRPEFVEAVINYWKNNGANRIFLFENCTQSNFTRMVFEINGYKAVCKRTGAIPVYLDEDKTQTLKFIGKSSSKKEEDGYDGTEFEMPKFIIKNLISEKDANLYISLPKLKTHSMAGVTLGVKNQWGFPAHVSRGADHNFNLPYKLVDVLQYIRPDFTMIEGIEATINGHYPVTAFACETVMPFGVILGGKNVVATDIVGAKLFGMNLDEVTHLRLAVEKNLSDGVESLKDIVIDGDISAYNKKYDWDIPQIFPDDIKIIKGKTRCCKEGCQNNPLMLLQALAYDFGGRGGFQVVMGKGHDMREINSLEGPVFLSGHCAIDEVYGSLEARLGKNMVYCSGKCNDLASSATALFHLMKVSPIKFLRTNPILSAKCFMEAKLNGSSAMTPSPLCSMIKLR